MKTYLLTAIILITCFTSFAQRKYSHLYPGYFGNGSSSQPTGLRIGLKAGIAQTDITRELLVNPNLEDSYEPIFKPTAGLMLQYGLSPRILISSGLDYSPMAVNYKTITSTENTVTQTRRNYLQIPLLLHGTLRKGEYNPYPAIYAGATIGYLLTAERDFESFPLNETQEGFSEYDIETSDSFNQMDYGITAGVSYYIPFQTYYQIMIDLKGYLGMANINNLAADAIDRPFTVNQTISLSLGLIWGR